MADEVSNDNAASTAQESNGPDSHGHAALLLVESLIHSLIDLSVISVSDAVEVVATAAEVKADIVAEQGGAAAGTDRSLILLEAISSSLNLDAGGK